MIKKAALAFAGVVVAGGVALAIAIFWHIDRHRTSDSAADATFAEVRHRLVNAQPLLIVDDQLQLIVRRDAPASGRPIAVLHTLAYTSRTHAFVRADFPRWLLDCVTAGGYIRLLNIDIIQKNGERLTLADLDRHGPGLIFDARLPTGRTLVWTE